jgi:hypothetical protein
MTPSQRAIYQQLLIAARSIGSFSEDPKKTSIHLIRKSAFAGVATRKDALLVTIKAGADIRSRRTVKHQRTSAKRWYLDVRLEHPEDIDRELTSWLAAAMALAS